MFSAVQSAFSKGIELFSVQPRPSYAQGGAPQQPQNISPMVQNPSEALLVASHSGNLEALRELQSNLVALNDSPLDGEGNNCFLLAVAGGSVLAVEAFLKEGAKVLFLVFIPCHAFFFF